MASKRIIRSLDDHLRFEKLLSLIATTLIDIPVAEIDGELQKGLGAFVNFLGVDRGTVFLFAQDRSRLERVYSWTEHGISPSPDRFDTEVMPWTVSKLLERESIIFDRVSDLPDNAWLDKEAIRKYNIKSATMIPMVAGGTVIGSVAVSTTKGEIAWPHQLMDRLEVIGVIFANALTRKMTEESLRRALEEITKLKEQLEAENVYLRKEVRANRDFDNIIGDSPALKWVLLQTEQVAGTDTTVLILGETGTGKELIARAIHDMSRRKNRPLIMVNCAALPSSLIESELFGREKGAYTGAHTSQIGRFELAHGSTLCLDEIGELPTEMQGKLLRVIQDGSFERLGSSQTRKIDVRIIASTNRDLEKEVRNGRFRQDLFYRLNVFPIIIPPLRDRKEDIPLLVEAFVARYGRKLGKKITAIPKEVMRLLKEYPWPGNIRELESVIEGSLILSSGPVFHLADNLAAHMRPAEDRTDTLQDVEREHILRVLSETRWRIEGRKGVRRCLGFIRAPSGRECKSSASGKTSSIFRCFYDMSQFTLYPILSYILLS